MAGCKTCCDDVPQQVLIERVLKSLIRQMLLAGELSPGLSSCSGTQLAKDTKVPDCDTVARMIKDAIRDMATDTGPRNIRDEIIDVINSLLVDGTLSPGLQTCDGAALGKGMKIATCADLDCAKFKCAGSGNGGGGNNGGGTNPVDKYLTNVIIDEAAKTMTFKVKDHSDIVVDVTKFLEDLNDFVTNAVVDNAAKTVTLKVKNQPDVVINLADMLGNAVANDTYHTVKQPTFNNNTRVLTIPQERFLNGASQGVDNWEITIPATGNSPGADNDTKLNKVEVVESTVGNGKEYRVKVTDTEGSVFESATTIEVPAAVGSVTAFDAEEAANGNLFKTSTFKLTAGGQQFDAAVDIPTLTTIGARFEANPNGPTHPPVSQLITNHKDKKSQVAFTLVDGPFLPVAAIEEFRYLPHTKSLRLSLSYYSNGARLPNYRNPLTVDLSEIIKAQVAGTGTPVSSNGQELPVKLYGKNRDALLAEPEAWEEVVASDGQTYLRPLYKKA